MEEEKIDAVVAFVSEREHLVADLHHKVARQVWMDFVLWHNPKVNGK